MTVRAATCREWVKGSDSGGLLYRMFDVRNAKLSATNLGQALPQLTI